MRGLVFRRHGGPEVLALEEVDKPSLKSTDEALLRIRASAFNHLDIVAREGLPDVAIPLPHISGTDICGTIEERRSTGRLKPGDNVIIYPGISCGTCYYCTNGHENRCPAYKLIGFFTDGGFADYCVVPSVNLFPMPKNLNPVEASSIPLVFLTAWHALVDIAEIEERSCVLIPSVGSGLSIACLQVSKLFGSTVVATTSTNEKISNATNLGADRVINYTKSDWVREAFDATHGEGFDIAVDHLGGQNWNSLPKLMKNGGIIISLGSSLGNRVQTDLSNFYLKEISVRGSFVGTKSEFSRVLELFEQGKLKPVIDSVYDLSEAQAAQERLASGKNFGKVVLKVS